MYNIHAALSSMLRLMRSFKFSYFDFNVNKLDMVTFKYKKFSFLLRNC